MTERIRCLHCGCRFEAGDALALRRAVQLHVDVDCRKPMALGH